MTLSKRFVPNDPIFQAGGKLDSRPSHMSYRTLRLLSSVPRTYFKVLSKDPATRLGFSESKDGWYTTLTLYGMKWVLDDLKTTIERDLKIKDLVIQVD